MSLAIAQRPDPRTLAAQARSLLDQGHPGAAQPILAALRALGAAATLTADLEARLLYAQGRAGDAVAVLDAVLASERSSALFLTRAELRLSAGEPAGAAADAAEAVTLDPLSPAPKALLGHALLHLGRAADAVACLDEVLAAHPHAVSARLDLAAALDAIQAPDLGEAVLAGGIALAPRNPALRSAALLRRIRAEDFAAAVALAETARQLGALDACGFGLMGHALSSLGRHGEAADAYTEALKLAPEDQFVRHLVAAAGRVPAAERAPGEYIRVLFDGYADRFDHHLIQLGYRVPGLIHRTISRRQTTVAGPTLDLGCGTGLLALVCQDLTQGQWLGIDLSAKMLESAKNKALYNELHNSDILTYLAAEDREFPLILAGDVLCYFGNLQLFMQKLAPRLLPGGRFIGTVERLDSTHDEVRLGRMGRYAHSKVHVLTAAQNAGLAVTSIEKEVLRFDGDAPVPGLLLVLEPA